MVEPDLASRGELAGAGPIGKVLFLTFALGECLLAFLLRVDGFTSQIAGGDELHLVELIQLDSLWQTLAGLTDKDASIPLALFGLGLGELVPLNEWLIRLPVFVAGVAAPGLFALMARRFVGAPAALLLGLCIALHPFFSFYSRFARPYGLCALLALAVLVALDRWHRGERPRASLVGAALLGALAAWLNLVSLVFVGLAFGVALLRVGLERPAHRSGRGRPFIAIALAGLACLLLTALLYAPSASVVLEETLRGKVAAGRLDAEVVERNVQIAAGTPSSIIPWLLAASVLAGTILLALRSLSNTLLLAGTALGHIAVILGVEPYLIEFELVLARYVFVSLPVLLLLACLPFGVAAEWAIRQLRAGAHPGRLVGAVVLAAVFGWFALEWLRVDRSITDWPNNYANHNGYQTFAHLTQWPSVWRVVGERELEANVPGFYAQLARREEPGAVLEWPPPRGFDQNPYPLYQWVHRRPIQLLSLGEEAIWTSPPFEWSNVIVAKAGEPLDLRGFEFVVVHKDLRSELRITIQTEASDWVDHYDAAAVRRVSERLEEICGPPLIDGRLLRVYRVP